MLAAAARLNGEYGLKDLYLGVPVIMGAKGAEKVLEVELSANEKEALLKSAAEVQSLISVINQSA